MALDSFHGNNQYQSSFNSQFIKKSAHFRSSPHFPTLNNPYEKYDRSSQFIPAEKDSALDINNNHNNYPILNQFDDFQKWLRNYQRELKSYNIEHGTGYNQNEPILSERKPNYLHGSKNYITETNIPTKSYKGLEFISKLPDYNQLNSLRKVLRKDPVNDSLKHVWNRSINMNTKPYVAQDM